MIDLQTVSLALESLSSLAGVPVIWKTMTMWHIHEWPYPEKQYHHCSAFCNKVKERHYEACCVAENTQLLHDATGVQTSFVKSCHAGVLELVVPVVCTGRIHGFLIAGPFREKQTLPMYTNTRGEYRRLPIWDDKQREKLESLLSIFGHALSDMSLIHAMRHATDPRIVQAQQYIAQHFMQALRVEDVAAHCMMSQSRFIHLFSQEVGIPFSRYLILLRIEHVKSLLADHRLSKAEIALETGFSDQSHMAMTFRKVTGMTPGQYQNHLRKLSDSFV